MPNRDQLHPIGFIYVSTAHARSQRRAERMAETMRGCFFDSVVKFAVLWQQIFRSSCAYVVSAVRALHADPSAHALTGLPA
jgi:hypothetical protein